MKYVRVRVTLRLTIGRSVGQSVSQSFRPSVLALSSSGTCDYQTLAVVRTVAVLSWGVLPVERTGLWTGPLYIYLMQLAEWTQIQIRKCRRDYYPGYLYSIHGRGMKGFCFHFTTASRTTLEPTQAPIQWVPGALSLGIKWQGLKLHSHLHLMPRSGMHGAISPVPLRLHGVVLS
jgi:hypothetical protein